MRRFSEWKGEVETWTYNPTLWIIWVCHLLLIKLLGLGLVNNAFNPNLDVYCKQPFELTVSPTEMKQSLCKQIKQVNKQQTNHKIMFKFIDFSTIILRAQ